MLVTDPTPSQHQTKLSEFILKQPDPITRQPLT